MSPTSADPQTNAGASPAQEIARLAGLRAVHDAFEWFRTHARDLSERQLEVTRVAAPPFGEKLRSEWLRERFAELGLTEVYVDELGNVFGVRPGSRSDSKYVALTAHLDTVFPAGTPMAVRRDGEKLFGPGIADNGTGMVALLGLAAAMQAAQVRNSAPIAFIANVGEEGEGDLRGMRYIFSRPPWSERIGYTVVVDGAGHDGLVTEALGSRRLEVTVHGPGGHSWSDFGTPNPIVLLSRIVEKFSRTPLPVSPKTTFNIGVISGGTSVNSIPESASMKVDIRSASAAEMERVERALQQAAAEVVQAEQRLVDKIPSGGRELNVSFEIKPIGSRPGAELRPDAQILKIVRAVDAQLGIHARSQRASTDANIPLSMGREAVAVGGGGTGGGAHTVHEWYDPTNRDQGLKRVLLIVLGLAGVEE